MPHPQSLSHIKDTIPFTDSSHAFYEPLFSGHSLQPIHDAAAIRENVHLVWPAILLFIALALVVFARASEPRKLVRVFTSLYSLQASRQLQREDYKIGKRLSVVLLIVFLISSSFFLYLLNGYFGFILQNKGPFAQYMFFASVICAVYVFKYLFSMMLAYIINATDLIKEYIFNVSVFSQVSGVALFPFIIAIEYAKCQAEWFLYPAIILFLLLYAFRFIRGFMISAMEQGIGIFYIFLYLCALEILPLLVLIKFLLTSF